jgi:hypothetical protein
MLYQEENQTVRPLLSLAIVRVMIVVLWILLDEMMHKVGTRHRQESKECQDSTKHAKATSSPAHLSPPLPAPCPEGTHSGTVLTDNVLSLKMIVLPMGHFSALLIG